MARKSAPAIAPRRRLVTKAKFSGDSTLFDSAVNLSVDALLQRDLSSAATRLTMAWLVS